MRSETGVPRLRTRLSVALGVFLAAAPGGAAQEPLTTRLHQEWRWRELHVEGDRPVTGIAGLPDGVLANTTDGLWRYDGSRWRTLSGTTPSEPAAAHHALPVPGGLIANGTGGVYSFENDRWDEASVAHRELPIPHGPGGAGRRDRARRPRRADPHGHPRGPGELAGDPPPGVHPRPRTEPGGGPVVRHLDRRLPVERRDLGTPWLAGLRGPRSHDAPDGDHRGRPVLPLRAPRSHPRSGRVPGRGSALHLLAGCRRRGGLRARSERGASPRDVVRRPAAGDGGSGHSGLPALAAQRAGREAHHHRGRPSHGQPRQRPPVLLRPRLGSLADPHARARRHLLVVGERHGPRCRGRAGGWARTPAWCASTAWASSTSSSAPETSG